MPCVCIHQADETLGSSPAACVENSWSVLAAELPARTAPGLGYGSPVPAASSDGVNPIWWRSEGGGVMSRRIASNTARNWRS